MAKENSTRTSKHTPGPWQISRLDERCIGHVDDRIEPGFQSNFHAVAQVRERTGETLANARLIAAAPALLVRLKEAVEILHDSTDVALNTGLAGLDQWLIEARADIAKAEGFDV